MTALAAKIRSANRGRLESLLPLKWAKMAASPHGFFRGAAALFYEEWSRHAVPPTPLTWACGDAHVENLGSFRSDNGIAYFDLNDFDDTLLAPAGWDVGRAWVSLELAGFGDCGRHFFGCYAQALAAGKASHVEREIAQGPVLKLLEAVEERTPKSFLKERVRGKRLRHREGHTYPISDTQKRVLLRAVQAWRAKQPDPAAWRVLDLCGRIAGNGSLGLERYLVLVEGHKHPRIFDFKEAVPAAGTVWAGAQPRWASEAARIVSVQRQAQYMPARRLIELHIAKPFVVREYQPYEDRVNLEKLDRNDLKSFVGTWAVVLASAHLRSASWKGAATLDEWVSFGKSCTPKVCERWERLAVRVAASQRRQAAAFAGAYEADPSLET